MASRPVAVQLDQYQHRYVRGPVHVWQASLLKSSDCLVRQQLDNPVGCIDGWALTQCTVDPAGQLEVKPVLSP
eukprot:187887-Pleurochrysis_carterae.AAC.1